MRSDSAASTATLAADDLEIGQRYDLGLFAVTESDIIDFSNHWDPQPFHCDPEVAREGYFGGIIASGVHTFAIFQRLAASAIYSSWAVIAGRRISDIELPRPVRGGMELHGSVTVVDIRHDKPGRSLVCIAGQLTAGEETVFSLRCEMYVRNTAS
ncbi:MULTISPECIES: MaoC/PaaZ C-terminal domain-containing protein [unclassified Rhodococcus (in: high G+C Gram-positive bacteria)]|uniref:MaoC/PaaZ C-terminal domain-containing protein n=1 Tax=unclassified Rhodococcus (in: high G+C Gram-positive bacteria) TaxID=192944 RepID=UPI001639AF29|nr:MULTISPECIES: MaoC/PaaZ C-terminal domain-containing protein [unclassified Rhodococcus (in: high G+C Gram-positive bacteria)]MBC2637597.1 hypothetical protein [Rhodococcus sp. 3A]MBC2644266.1 hypothetical protein [Rhodococcus sp. 3A]MBC2890996.1 hypothetical protein [Rhodococcus sp. 4CII]MBC2897659.1 hypothetical protein [Rhodococcus sp. 4CII]